MRAKRCYTHQTQQQHTEDTFRHEKKENACDAQCGNQINDKCQHFLYVWNESSECVRALPVLSADATLKNYEGDGDGDEKGKKVNETE